MENLGDYVWLSLSVQKLHNNAKGKSKPIEEVPFKIVHRDNYDTLQVMLGGGVCFPWCETANDLIP